MCLSQKQTKNKTKQITIDDLRCSSMVQNLSSMSELLSFIPSIHRSEEKEEEEDDDDDNDDDDYESRWKVDV
jgi:signal recognition particle GTPase